jgi:hypothetical protein
VRFKDRQPLKLLKRGIKMKRALVITLAILMSCFLSSPVYATLIDHGNGLIYDTDFSITWLQAPNNTNMTWDQANTWAISLTAGGVLGWRLPSISHNFDTGGEMGHLYFVELGNKASFEPGWGLINKGLFTNLQPFYYWSSTEMPGDPERAWGFDFNEGYPFVDYKTYPMYALEVHEGNIGATHTPIPGAVFLFAPGLVGLAILRKKFIKSFNR